MTVTASSQAPILLTVPETCALLRISRWMVYDLIRRGQLQTIKIGSRRLVPAISVDQLLADLSKKAA